MANKFCSNCGKELIDGANACIECGQHVNVSVSDQLQSGVSSVFTSAKEQMAKMPTDNIKKTGDEFVGVMKKNKFIPIAILEGIVILILILVIAFGGGNKKSSNINANGENLGTIIEPTDEYDNYAIQGALAETSYSRTEKTAYIIKKNDNRQYIVDVQFGQDENFEYEDDYMYGHIIYLKVSSDGSYLKSHIFAPLHSTYSNEAEKEELIKNITITEFLEIPEGGIK